MRSRLGFLRREFFAAYHSSITYAVTACFLIASAIWLFYIQRFFLRDEASLRVYFEIFPLLFTVLVPVLTMRGWAAERRLGTDELLLSLPLSEASLVLGKFLGSFSVIVLCLILTTGMPLSLLSLGDFDLGPLLCQYLGSLLFGAASVALGLLAASMARHQVGAFLLGFILLLLLTTVNQVNAFVDLPLFVGRIINGLSVSYHFQSFAKGIVDTRDLAYFMGITFLALFLNGRVLLLRRWS